MTNSINYIASLSLFADLFTYTLGIAAAYGLRKKLPDLRRPYRAPFILAGTIISIAIYMIMITQLGSSAIISGIIWSVLGMVLYFGYQSYKKGKGVTEAQELQLVQVEFEDPPEEEKVKMDREYKVWRSIVWVAVVVSVALYVIPYFVV